MKVEHDNSHIKGSEIKANYQDFGDDIAFQDAKLSFVCSYTRGLDVLDLGCVQHNKENYNSRYWLHKAIAAGAKSLKGLDLSLEGVQFLQAKGLDVIYGDAQNFSLAADFDVIVAGDIIEHLDNLHGFLQSCKKHLRKNGRLIVTTPNPWYWRFIVKSALKEGNVPVNLEHTCWLCPRTLSQLLERNGMRIAKIEHGSRYKKDLLVPLPKGLKHTSFYSEIFVY